MSPPTEGWGSHVVAAWWQRGFTEGADPEYAEQLLPLAAEHLAGAGDILDVGCGEAQVARVAATDPGARRVVGVDPSWPQLCAARARGPGQAGVGEAPAVGTTPGDGESSIGGSVRLAAATAASLPFPRASFDAVVACLVFEHLEDAAGALAEVGRVLRPGGRFVFLLNHPLLQTPGSGWVDDQVLGEQFWRIGPYLEADHSWEEVDDGIWLPYVHRPLSFYINALAGAGLVVTRMEEPPPPPGFLAAAVQEYPEAASIPRLLFLRAEKLPDIAR